jgi:hypothetical protein
MVSHPRPHLENFMRFQFGDQLVESGLVRQITVEDKKMILAENYARMHGLDLPGRLAAIKGDEFAQRRADGLADPYSTTAAGDRVA